MHWPAAEHDEKRRKYGLEARAPLMELLWADFAPIVLPLWRVHAKQADSQGRAKSIYSMKYVSCLNSHLARFL